MGTLTSIFGWNRKEKGWILGIGLLLIVGVGWFEVPRARAQDELTLTVDFVGGGNALDFGRLRNLEEDGTPTRESATRQVRITVTPSATNVKPYTVSQVVSSPFTHQAGGVFPMQAIVYRVEEEVGTGTVRVPGQTPLALGEEEIYRSAATGGNSRVLITYDLTAAPEEEAGAYLGTMVYRASNI